MYSLDSISSWRTHTTYIHIRGTKSSLEMSTICTLQKQIILNTIQIHVSILEVYADIDKCIHVLVYKDIE